MSDDTQSKRLPATWEEYQRARRNAFLDGSYWRERQLYIAGNSASLEAAHRYPIVRKVPREIILEGGQTARGTADGVEIDGFGLRTIHTVTLRRGTVQALAELARNPFDEVSE